MLPKLTEHCQYKQSMESATTDACHRVTEENAYHMEDFKRQQAQSKLELNNPCISLQSSKRRVCPKEKQQSPRKGFRIGSKSTGDHPHVSVPTHETENKKKAWARDNSAELPEFSEL